MRGRRYCAANTLRRDGGLLASARLRIVSAAAVALALGFAFGLRTEIPGNAAPQATSATSFQTVPAETIRVKTAVSSSSGRQASIERSWRVASLDIALAGETEDDSREPGSTASIPARVASSPRLASGERAASFDERWGATFDVSAASFDDRWSAIGLPGIGPSEEIIVERAERTAVAPREIAARAPTRSVVARPAPVRLASLTPANVSSNALESDPDAGTSAEADGHTAIYDIAAHTVYMPDGRRLEAHSGLGSLLDNPHYVSAKDRGPTPPNVYQLSLRESLFHGVRALRLTPVGDGKMYGRDGLLAHTYMLGANGQSNGCVSFNDYSTFLSAYLDGEVTRLVVVEHLANAPASKTAASGWIAEKLRSLFSHS